MNNYSKGLMSILVISLLLIPSILPVVAFGFGQPSGADSEDWYITVEGVLEDDTYILYPYEKANLVIGISKFGELINTLEDVNIGLEYDGERDPFAPPAGSSTSSAMPKRSWNQGWLINITYMSVQTGEMRNIWASATHGDTHDYGNNWIRVISHEDDPDILQGPEDDDDEDPRDIGLFLNDDGIPLDKTNSANYGHGGRKTNGTVVTDPMEVLYDGPRRFVVRCVNHVMDWIAEDDTDVPLVDVILTFDFNKVKKEVNVFKDIKITADKTTYDYLPIEFFFPSEYEEWIDFNEDGEGYADPRDPEEWVTIQEVGYPYGEINEVLGLFIQFSNRGEWDLGEPNQYKSYAHFWTEGDWGFGLPWEDFTTVNTPFDDPTVDGLWTPYDYEYTLTTTIFPNWYSRHGPEPIESDGSTFDMAQIIGYEPGGDPEYVGFAAFWPSLSDWRIAGIGQWFRSVITDDPHRTDGPTEPFRSPYVVGEWDFLLAWEDYTIDSYWENPIKVDKQFRGVTAYGLMDIHLDAPEIDYQWSKFYDIPCTDVPEAPEFAQEPYEPSEIDSRIGPAVIGAGDDHDIGTGHKNVIDREVGYQLYEKFKPWDLRKASEKWTSRWVEFSLGLDDDDELDTEDVMGLPDEWGEDTYDYIYLEATNSLVGLPFYSLAYYGDGILGDDMDADIGFEMGEWGAYGTFPERVLVELDPVDEPGELTLLQRGEDYVIVFLDNLDNTYVVRPDANDAYILFIDDGDVSEPLELEEGALIKVLYSTWYAWDNPIDWGRGSYEWIVAGRDAASVDALGSSMITQAFDSIKDIHVWKPGLDMQENELIAPKIPFLLRNFDGTATYTSYHYDHAAGDHRTALKDDYCSTVPISSSNIITVGGPLANVVTEYFNEFGQVIYRGGAWFEENDFLLTSDWGATFMDHGALDTTLPGGWTEEEEFENCDIETQVGIGIVETYMDINGTVGLVVYGYNGQDTTWTSDLFFNFNNIPLFLDDGDGVLEWDDDSPGHGTVGPLDMSDEPGNENCLFDPEDLEYGTKWVPKLHQEATGWWAGDDLMLGWMWEDEEGDLKWTFMPLIVVLQKENPGVTSLVIKLYYDLPVTDNPTAISEEELFSEDSHPVALIVEELGTISEKPQHPDP